MNFLFWAYTIFWLLLAGYLLYVFLRLRRTENRLNDLERELERRSRQG
ncbi:MAG TPA: CcmD family protein [Candidatus Polarisedimenticolaceae bacterium]|nr:CcmD family protein [Candidatus Polarisedimenticolaceae bacterium]